MVISFSQTPFDARKTPPQFFRTPVFIITAALILSSSAVALTGADPETAVDGPTNRGAEILWDTWGVPHLSGRDLEAVGFAFGWAQMEAHGDLLLHLYGESRGRSAEYWGGEENLERDKFIQTFGIPELAADWMSRQPPEFATLLRGFVAGLNAYASDRKQALAPAERVVLPVTGTDVIGHLLRAIHLTFVAGMAPGQLRSWEGTSGSNAWAVSPRRTASGHALLLANPHLPWSGLFIWFESQWSAPGLEGYGVTLIGLPVLAIAFNQHLGWTHTVNTHDGCDLYELTLAENGYRWNGQVKPFETREKTLKVRQPDGSLTDQKLTVRRSIHGPVIAQKAGRALAIRVVGLDSPGIGQEYLDLLHARNLAEFELPLRRLQIPMFTIMYADSDGHILHLFGGQTPVRPPGPYDWSGIVPGDTSATLWTNTLPYEQLPRIVDPASGWLQNANDPPWTTTFPAAIDRSKFPAYLAPRGMGLRPQRSAQLLMANDHFTFEEFIRAKHDTHVQLADRVLDDLLAAADKQDSAKAREGAAVLRAWDRNTDNGSRGAELFRLFVAELSKRNRGPIPFRTPWNELQPLQTPRGLADPAAAVGALEAAVDSMRAQHQPLDIAWGEIHRFRHGVVNLPGNGGPADTLGIFRAASYRPGNDGVPEAVAGDTYVCAVEFSNPVRAMASLAYGNASQPGSKHATDQLELASRKQLRPVWLKRSEIEAHLERREAF